ncbi:Uncharacterised protein [Shigella sonnei]|nr:Uncharacterised protein [Shigella sonnei]
MGMVQECLVLIEGYDPYVVNVSRMADAKKVD